MKLSLKTKEAYGISRLVTIPVVTERGVTPRSLSFPYFSSHSPWTTLIMTKVN